mmetsp:Transcript_76073/g.158645  ORF Transcript_76073/g.158645 Transcript_76073/m.158645 type:complete len:91 (+) Transcript_76073:324-596(+)
MLRLKSWWWWGGLIEKRFEVLGFVVLAGFSGKDMGKQRQGAMRATKEETDRQTDRQAESCDIGAAWTFAAPATPEAKRTATEATTKEPTE